jgi:hypothetical protein
MNDAFRRAVRALASPDVPDGDLSRPFVEVLPIGGVSVSSFGALVASETISASDHVAFRIDEIQFDLTEGPCWTALRIEAPVLECDIVENPNESWPAFNDAVRDEPVGAVFAFPIVFGPFPLGAVDVYSPSPTEIAPEQVQQGVALASALGRRILRRALHTIDEDVPEDRSPFSRRVVHQATGVVLAQLDISPDDAYLLIQGHAFARRTSMRHIAEEILDGSVRFETHGGLIEEAR